MAGQDLATDFRNLPLQASNTRFAGIVTDDVPNDILFDLDLFFRESICLDLFWQQVLHRDVDLLVLCIPWYTDDLHAIKQRPGNIQGICSTDKQNL